MAGRGYHHNGLTDMLVPVTSTALLLNVAGLPPHAPFAITGMGDLLDGLVRAPSFTLHAPGALVEIDPGLSSGFFAKSRMFRALRFHLTWGTALTFLRLDQGSFHNTFVLHLTVDPLFRR